MAGRPCESRYKYRVCSYGLLLHKVFKFIFIDTAGLEIHDTLSLLPRIGMSSYGIWLLHAIHPSDMLLYALMPMLFRLRFIQRTGKCFGTSFNVDSYISAFDSQILLVLLATGEAFVCDMRKQYKSRVELLEILMEEGHVDEDDESNGNVRVRYDSRCSLKTISYLFHVRFPMTVARFDPSGKFIFIGTASGKVLVFNTRTKMVRLTSS